ncbi:helix-turn-helix domain-containing protein [Streptomyces nymphaeiformis]|uniref:DNA-directed RNA polymerase specialized sigma24 family protein/transcriptional regulator with XRE-family HTH domain n=1 Tax=Streptomyces nymphaeiformis TaxID=2663842 RepID=A0A7W7U1W8_9ACTN|nr:helix-turn-helix domain-containing protein [Streptomyces nymphaeiformis]MBB4983528.1 DNA-directed RNA polymerase specialized sigma24 family protein/transcriptional regulator with XRE-family HTH domain [Streptomyces nymphaeiformis]
MSRSTADSASSAALPTPKERRRLREALALTEEQVAEAMGVTKATIRSWETGRSAPRGRKREAYARLLGEGEAGAHAAQAQAQAEAEAQPGRAEAQAVRAQAEAVQARAEGVQARAEGVQARAEGVQAQAEGEPGRPQAAAEAQAHVARPQAQAQPPASGNVRPRAAGKRAAKPPRGPVPVPGIAAGPGRNGASKEPERLKPVDAPAEPGLTPEEAFDALYAYAAPGLVHQTYLLTGRRRLSREAVERAFHHAWDHWPEVAVDADPVGWVRATAYEYALSPWHRFRRAHKHPDAPPTEANRRALLGALLELPPPYRRTVLLYDGLGLDLPETAAETEASTPAAANRLLHARTVIGKRLPELAEPEALHRRLSALVAEAPTATLPAARTVRSGSERQRRKWTRVVLGVTAVLIGVTGFTAATAPTRYIPVNAPGETVNGVPVRGGPQKLRPEDLELREKLRSEPNPGPERLVPAVE